MDEKEKILDELFVSEEEAQKQPKKNTEPAFASAKDNDSKSINSAVNDLSKEFDKKNKDELNKRKKSESVRSEVEAELADGDDQKTRKSKVSFLLSLLSFPFVLIGGILIWNYLISPKEINPAAILTVLMCVTGFAIGVKSFIVGVKKEGGFKDKIKPLLLGLLFVTLSVLIIVFRPYIEQFALLVVGCLGTLVSFITVLASAIKRVKKNGSIVKIIMSALACVGAVLLILAGSAFSGVTLYLQITGFYLVVVGCALFVF